MDSGQRKKNKKKLENRWKQPYFDRIQQPDIKYISRISRPFVHQISWVPLCKHHCCDSKIFWRLVQFKIAYPHDVVEILRYFKFLINAARNKFSKVTDFKLQRTLRYESALAVLDYKLRISSHSRPAMPFGHRKNILEDLFNSVLSQSKKYHPSENPKLNYLGIFQRLKLRIFIGIFFQFILS